MKERPHGFRSSFRDWVAAATNTPHDVSETALGHTRFVDGDRAKPDMWCEAVPPETGVTSTKNG
jgi:hypothetical protein